MNAGLLLFTQSTLCALDIVMNGERNLTDSLLHFIHTDIVIQIAQDILQSTLFRNIATNILFLNQRRLGTSADKRRENVFSRLDSQMGVSEGIVLDFQLILEVTQQLTFCLRRIGCYTIF